MTHLPEAPFPPDINAEPVSLESEPHLPRELNAVANLRRQEPRWHVFERHHRSVNQALLRGRSNGHNIETSAQIGRPPRGPSVDAVETFIRREDAERFVEDSTEVLGLANDLQVEERELEAGGRN